MSSTSTDTKNGSSNDLPVGTTPIDMRQLFEVIGELYFQIRIQQQTIQRLASSPSSKMPHESNDSRGPQGTTALDSSTM